MNGEFVEIGNVLIEIPLGISAFVVSSLLGFLVYRNNPKSWTNRLFLLLVILIDSYIVVNFLSIHPPIQTPAHHLFWIRIVMFVTSFIGPSLFLFVHTFPRDKISLPKKYLFSLGVLAFASAGASLSNLVFEGIRYPEGNPTPIPGPGISLFAIDFVGLFVLSFIVLAYKYRHSTGLERTRIAYLSLGALASFTLMGLTTVLFVVILQTSSFVFLGPIYPVILMTFIAYAIVKYNLFNIKVLATQVLVAIIWIILFTKIFTAQVLTERVIDGFVFLATFVFGILLIRSVRNEVEQREKLENLTKELEVANRELKRLDAAKSEFVSIASHQLRTPLTAIKGYISLILEGTYGAINKKLQRPLKNVYDSNERLVRLVNDLLSLSRIESGKMKLELEKTDLKEMIHSVLNELKIKAEQKNLKLVLKDSAQPSGPVLVDSEKIRNVILNLVDNSIRYTEKGSIIVSTVQKNNRLRLSVQDTGVGMTKQEINKLFESFSRGQAGVKLSTEGAGLGLYIAKQFVQMHKGKIWAESPGKDKGSTFVIELPLQPS